MLASNDVGNDQHHLHAQPSCHGMYFRHLLFAGLPMGHDCSYTCDALSINADEGIGSASGLMQLS